MNKFLSFAITCVVFVLANACTKQNIPVPLDVKPQLQRSDEYFANLRAYKASSHQIYFGWFGGTGVPGSPDFPGVLDGIPDSVDVVSLWGGIPPYDSYNHQLINKTQQLKGTKFVVVDIADDEMIKKYVPDFFDKYYNKGDSLLGIGIELVVKSINDTITKYRLDGYDWDYEPSGRVWGHNNLATRLFVQKMAKYFGPKSGTGKWFDVDGYVEDFDVNQYELMDYAIAQNYIWSGGNNANPTFLQQRFQLNNMHQRCPPGKYVSCVSFEIDNSGLTPAYTHPIHGKISAVEGTAYWQPVQGRKGGAGAYHSEYQYASGPIDYISVRRAIQIMNPAAK